MGLFSFIMMNYNEDRDEEALIALRPELFLEAEDALEIEKFQNTSLRPILKLQHNLLLDVLTNQPNFDALLAYKNKRSVFQERLRIFMQQPILKGIFLGMVIGNFTQVEYKTYLRNGKEYNHRIVQMLIQRFVDSI